jgi:hypothetical protein
MVDLRRPACIRASTERGRADSRGRTDAAAAVRSYRRGHIDERRIPMSRRRSIRWSRLAATAVAAAALCAGAGARAGAAPHAVLCVGGKPECFTTIQAAVDAAGDGDTVHLAAGGYAGGITIDKSLELDGAGAGATVVSGGGPVVTIGSFVGDNDITVSIDGVTITGGLNDSHPDTSVVAGGGVWIPGSAGNATGATVTISHSVIAGNRVTASATIPPGGFSCKGSPTPCAFVNGGGIDNSGVLTLDHTEVTGNTAGSAASPGLESSASGGGIDNHRQGTLVLRHSTVSGNTAVVSLPDGAFADGGGISSSGALMIADSAVDGNSSLVTAAVPSSFPFAMGEEATAGGIYVGDGARVAISHATVDRNTVGSSNADGDADAEGAGIHDHGTLVLDHVSVSGNSGAASVPTGSGFLATTEGGALELGPRPSAATASHARLDGNSLRADSPGGVVFVSGAGVVSLDGTLTLDHADVSGNSGAANGATGVLLPTGKRVSELGGGIQNVSFGGSGPTLTLDHTTVTGNTLTTTSDTAPRGGGIFTRDIFSDDPFPVSLDHSAVSGNSPDDCDGC